MSIGIQKTFNLDMVPGGAPPVIHVSAGDVGRPFRAVLLYNGETYDLEDVTSVKIRGTKPDKTVFEYALTFDDEDSHVDFVIEEQMAIIAGQVLCEIRLFSGDDTIGSANFVLDVEQNCFDPDASSESDITTISDYVAETVNEYLEEHPESIVAVPDGGITTAKLADEAVTTGKLATGAVTNAKLADGIEDCWADEITVSTYRTLDTDCYVMTIPATDSGGAYISPYVTFDSVETPAEYARNHGTTATINGAANMQKTDDTWQVPYVYSRGIKIYGTEWTGTPKPNDARIISISADRTVTDFPITATQAQLEAGGVYTTLQAYCRLVTNGAALDLTDVTGNEEDWTTRKSPCLAIGVKSDKTLIIFCCDGRTPINAGLTAAEVADEMITLGCDKAYMLDGGGSASLNYKCSKINRNIDGNGTVDRMIRFKFNVKKEGVNDFPAPSFAKAGIEKQRTIEQIIPFANYLQAVTGMAYAESFGVKAIPTNSDLNDISEVGRYFVSPSSAAATLSNCPTNVSFVMDVEYINGSQLFYTIKDYNGDVYYRRNHIYGTPETSHFTEWKKADYESRQSIIAGSKDISVTVAANGGEAYSLEVPVTGLTSAYKVVCSAQWTNGLIISIRQVTTGKFLIDLYNPTAADITSFRLNYICVN